MNIITNQDSKIKGLLILFFCIFALAGKGQVLAPDFLCVKSDTLFWNPVANPCGPFQSYDIYVSANESGPFSLLASISDPMQIKFFHTNPTNQQWYYYLESNHDCPGEQVLQSVILDNQPPKIPLLESVSVVGDDVLVEWTPSISPETFAYIIYRRTPLGTIPIDTVFCSRRFLCG